MEESTILAHKERGGGVLLAESGNTGDREVANKALLPRSKAPTNSRRSKGKAAGSNKEKGSRNAKNKNRSRGEGDTEHGESYTFRGNAGKTQKRNRTSGGSAKKLGLVWPGPVCANSPNNAHYYIQVGVEIFRCKHCHTYIWQPITWYRAEDFAFGIRINGVEKAYEIFINSNYKVRNLLAKLNDISKVEAELGMEKAVSLAIEIMNKSGYIKGR